MALDQATFKAALSAAKNRLLANRVGTDHWEGRLSSSALSTATALCALELYRRGRPTNLSVPLEPLIDGALNWIVSHQNADGGWGDTIDSPSNISTTVLCWCAIHLARAQDDALRQCESAAETWIQQDAGGLASHHLRDRIQSVYGADRTFAVPILTMCALSGRFGEGRQAWCDIAPLPFELAACPHQLFRWLRLSVVSYALPALIAIGQVGHHHRPTRNPFTRCLRNLTRTTTLRTLERIQPESGGFLEAAPLTSFVLMSLASIEQTNNAVARRAAQFLISTVRADGSWPIDTNLATWVTTLSVNALSVNHRLADATGHAEREGILHWIRRQQYQVEHPYTHAAPGAWAWTDLTGGVPDADDTAGALLAIKNLLAVDQKDAAMDHSLRQTVTAGVMWLVRLQNSDGGIPTFCRGWGQLPFDQSSPDLTAHALRAFAGWYEYLAVDVRRQVEKSCRSAVGYLAQVQRPDGAFIPLWFGNQSTEDQSNRLYGTSRVLCVRDVPGLDGSALEQWRSCRARALRWLRSAQQADGSFGGSINTPPSIEETGLALEALGVEHALTEGSCPTAQDEPAPNTGELREAIRRGTEWLLNATQQGEEFPPVPIGLYFAKLWYSERLYPLIFTVNAWQHAEAALFGGTAHR